MLKHLNVTVDNSTWPSSGIPAFPPLFHAGTRVEQININSTLLLIGFLTTPAAGTGVSLSELWAWVRYYYAVSVAPDLRLTREFWELDSHQKTILSDDFGMGFPLMYLLDKLGLVAWCDGRDFVDRFHALTVPRPSIRRKTGPTKCPDFVCLDRQGRFHVIECKGTQSGRARRAKQFSDTNANGQPTGAVVQKRMIVLQPSYSGQCLACGISIQREGASSASDLRIEDPEGDEKIVVGDDQVALAIDPIIRSTIARCLRAAGFPATADIIAMPSGPRFYSQQELRPGARHVEARRQQYLAERRRLAILELRQTRTQSVLEKNGVNFLGRNATLQLPKPLIIDESMYTKIQVRQGVLKTAVPDLIAAMRDAPILDVAPWVRSLVTGIEQKGTSTTADLLVGGFFFSDLAVQP